MDEVVIAQATALEKLFKSVLHHKWKRKDLNWPGESMEHLV